MSTFITRSSSLVSVGMRLAVKDNIDVAGLPSTCGSQAIAEVAREARCDAPSVAKALAAGAHVVGKTNLHELAFGATGINPWFGTPSNPYVAGRIPGGSSSGSAVAVATDQADIGIGSDTGGSVRIPAACCGVVGFKPTNGRLSQEGMVPLAQSLDTVGFIGRTVDAAAWGMSTQEAAFRVPADPGARVGRMAGSGDPAVEQAIDEVLLASELPAIQVALPGLSDAYEAAMFLLLYEAAQNHRPLLKSGDLIGRDVYESLERGVRLGGSRLPWVRNVRRTLEEPIGMVFQRCEVLACATLPMSPPEPGNASRKELTRNTRWVNLFGLPAVSVPLPRSRSKASLQLIGARGADELVLAVARRMESVIASLETL